MQGRSVRAGLATVAMFLGFADMAGAIMLALAAGAAYFTVWSMATPSG